MFALMLRNILRHPLRSVLTILGITVALVAFVMIRTLVSAWHSGVNASAKDRLVTRNAVSLVFYLPRAYQAQIAKVKGVSSVGYANWFGAIYKDESFRFTQFAIDDNYFDVYPELMLSAEEARAFKEDRSGAVVGKDLVEKYGFKVGDVIQLRGTIFPGLWQYTIRGIYHGKSEANITRTLFFHWEYLNERNKAEINRQPDQVGIYVIRLESGADSAAVSRQIDSLFANSFAETLTETETAFQQSFVSMSSTIILAMNIVSYVVIVIMLLVLANTMLMAARERTREFAILKSIGFERRHVGMLIFGEGVVLCSVSFLLLLALITPLALMPPHRILGELINFFPVFRFELLTIGLSFAAAMFVALLAGLAPYREITSMRVVEGLRVVR